MPSATITSTSELTQAEIESAERVRKKADQAVTLICRMVYQECPKASKAARQWLALALPDVSERSRYNYLHAGTVNARIAGACKSVSYGVSVGADAYPLLETDLDWLSEKQRTQREVRERKKAKMADPVENSTTTTTHRVDSTRSSKEDTSNEFLAPNQGPAHHAPAVGYEYVQSARPDACPVLLECVESLAKLYDIFKHYCVPENESWGYYDFVGLKNQLSHAQAYVIAAIEHREAEDGGSQPAIDVHVS